MPMPVRALLCLLAFALCAPAMAQTFPNHVDPRAREEVPNLSAVPTLRFLTSADFPPFNYRDGGGNLVGYHIDLAEEICARISARCTIQAWPWENVADALADNQGDALIAGLALSPEAGEDFDFSRIYLALPGRFVTPAEDAERFSPDRPGGPIAVRTGSAHERFVREQLSSAQIVGFATELEALEAVQAGEVRAFFGDAMRAAFWLNENPDCCAFAGRPYFRPDYFGPGLAIAFPRGRDEMREAVNWALVRLQQEGRMDDLYLRWFPVSFY